MDSKEHNKIIAFDTLFSTNQIQKLKIILPYMDNQMQKSMAVYIKFLELQYTIDFYKKHPYPLCGCMEKDSSPDFAKMCDELLPYCTESEKKQIGQIRELFKAMEMYQEISQTMEMMKDFMPDMDMSTLFQSFGGDFMGTGNSESEASSAEWEKADTTNKTDHTEKAASSHSGGSFDVMSLLMNMLSPEQKEMFEQFGGNKHGE